MSKAVIIKVSLEDSRPDTPKIKLWDSEGDSSSDGEMTTLVEPGAIVTWTADKASGIAEVTRITQTLKPSEENTYYDLIDWSVGKDGKDANGDVFATIISPSLGKDREMEYTIYFKIDGDDTEYSHDPKLKMKS